MRGFRSSCAVLVMAIVLLVVIGIAWEVMFAGRYQFPCTPNTGVTPMMPWMFWGGGMWIFPIIGLIVFLFVIYFVFTRVFPIGGAAGGRSFGEQSPLDILKIRYAKGEISREEFERMKKDIDEDGMS